MPDTNVSREERIARQALDDGDPAEDVYLPRTTRALFYHERDCYVLAQSGPEPRSMPRRTAKARWKAPCLRCVLAEVDVDVDTATA